MMMDQDRSAAPPLIGKAMEPNLDFSWGWQGQSLPGR
jgi:hypothetical protein